MDRATNRANGLVLGNGFDRISFNFALFLFEFGLEEWIKYYSQKFVDISMLL